jgi:hypothetical protein
MLDFISNAAALRLGQVRQKMEDIHLGFSFDTPEPLPEDPPQIKLQKQRDELRERLLNIGYRIGWTLAERFVLFTNERRSLRRRKAVQDEISLYQGCFTGRPSSPTEPNTAIRTSRTRQVLVGGSSINGGLLSSLTDARTSGLTSTTSRCKVSGPPNLSRSFDAETIFARTTEASLCSTTTPSSN